jgi:histone H2A
MSSPDEKEIGDDQTPAVSCQTPEPQTTKNKKTISKTQKSGVTFPAARINKYIKNNSNIKRVGGSSSIYMTAVIEYVVSEIIDSAGKNTLMNNRKTINIDDIIQAVRTDPDLSVLFASNCVCTGNKLDKIKTAISYVPAKKKHV